MQRKVKKLTTQREWMDPDGAIALATVVRDYWASRGYTVKVTLVDQGKPAARQGPVLGVRSDLFRGLPRAARPPGP